MKIPSGICPQCNQPFDDHWLPASAEPSQVTLCKKVGPKQ